MGANKNVSKLKLHHTAKCCVQFNSGTTVQKHRNPVVLLSLAFYPALASYCSLFRALFF